MADLPSTTVWKTVGKATKLIGDFWAELFKSVGQLFRNDDPDLILERGDLSAMMAAGDALDPTAATLSGLPARSMLEQAKAQLNSLHQIDPNFSESDFLIAASKTYSAMLAAEGAMDPAPLASLVTPAFMRYFQARVAKWRDGGFTRTVSDLSLDAPTIMKLSVDATQEAITVRFTGSARRFTKKDMTNLVSEGSAQLEPFTEFATFVRPAGTTTPKQIGNGGPVHCASCGAPLESGALKCAFCGAPVTGTGGTWLLDRTSSSAYT